MLRIGDQAPLFEANSTEGLIRLQDYIGRQPVVLIFYPMDETPGCTKQLCAVRDSKALYAAHHAVVMGINSGSLEQHHKFASAQGYDFPLVADANGSIRRRYAVGKMLGIVLQQRVVYVIGKNGRIQFAKKGLPPTEEIIAALSGGS
ncbi:peroxiredoxin [Paenibacillus beijingensis]|uniref:thioredoxin-dependent peroxiredoxin n=1 Tax=Paenibacillus beijingensis TaxID=1126833 RepID=A0A0D5NDR8_9BACL|nr:peroxiredoxin [Paenibacillus beijingensis]AJY73381.1 peroxiredoxin [Paenibacillus beijingensis]